MLKEDDDVGQCIGKGCVNDGCGFVGRESGDVCPECGGMILAPKELAEAERITENWRRSETKEAENSQDNIENK